ncbi:MAG: hypothetical protein F6K36_16835 [Symploca sp. SIO3C6]|uniref:Uncharacterized protein n=1 Tax=Symploca sp. SIO1C4 TaxID=2607765 RepID=A0A6B3NJ50_9CYAN|nr:hypothetical protein [Symploca sp. SIO3C6]NER30134.1 hypothetical protein [Symploca sp. SIO1C4]NET07447.1 hypothetical protein [Symploca sp. SIO2B6]
MVSQLYYLIRSQSDGRYLVAQVDHGDDSAARSYLLMFKEHFDALSYLNTHGSDVSDRFAVESASGTQIKGLLQRWSFTGIGIVQDPLIPQIEFLSKESSF